MAEVQVHELFEGFCKKILPFERIFRNFSLWPSLALTGSPCQTTMGVPPGPGHSLKLTAFKEPDYLYSTKTFDFRSSH